MIRRMSLKKLDKLTAGSVKLIETQIKYFNNQEDYEIMMIRAILISFFHFQIIGFKSYFNKNLCFKNFRF